MRKLTTMISFAALLSAAACTTNMNPGSGEPTRQAPAVGPTSPTSTPGTSGGNVPMISSFAATDPVAIVANRAEYRTKYLGPADPAPSGVVVSNDPATGQYQNPAVRANPQLTVNSTVSSPAIPTVVNDVTGGVVAVPVDTTASVTAPAPVATPGTTAGSAFVPTPAAASVSVATPTAATSAIASTSTLTTGGTAVGTVAVPRSMASASTSSATVTQSASVTVPTTSRLRIVSPMVGTGTSRIRIVRNTAGRVVVSNQQP